MKCFCLNCFTNLLVVLVTTIISFIALYFCAFFIQAIYYWNIPSFNPADWLPLIRAGIALILLIIFLVSIFTVIEED